MSANWTQIKAFSYRTDPALSYHNRQVQFYRIGEMQGTIEARIYEMTREGHADRIFSPLALPEGYLRLPGSQLFVELLKGNSRKTVKLSTISTQEQNALLSDLKRLEIVTTSSKVEVTALILHHEVEPVPIPSAWDD